MVCFVSFYVLFVCKCVLYFCHRVTTQLQLTNISYHIILYQTINIFYLCGLLVSNPSASSPQTRIKLVFANCLTTVVACVYCPIAFNMLGCFRYLFLWWRPSRFRKNRFRGLIGLIGGWSTHSNLVHCIEKVLYSVYTYIEMRRICNCWESQLQLFFVSVPGFEKVNCCWLRIQFNECTDTVRTPELKYGIQTNCYIW